MKRLHIFILFLMSFTTSWAQLSEKEQTQLMNSVLNRYQISQAEGASIYKTSSGYRVLVTITSVYAQGTIAEQNRQAQIKATRLASEFLNGAFNHSVSVYDAKSLSREGLETMQGTSADLMGQTIDSHTYSDISDLSKKTSTETLSDKVVQSSMAQVSAMQSLFKIEEAGDQYVYAYYLVISKTAAKNGVAGMLSIVPGLGQFYKGSVGKGLMFMSLAAASAAGIIVCECTRSSYANKAIEQPKYMKEYNTKADNWATGRNVCIGVGGAVWLWNVIDAFTTKSARRKVVINKNTDLTINPIVSPQDMGIGLTFNFK